MISLQKSDFTGGEYNITDSTGVYVQNDLQTVIDKYEPIYIQMIYGKTLGAAISAYLTSGRSPINADYDKIIDPFTDDTYVFKVSYGLKEALKACVFYEYMKRSQKPRQSGVVQPKAETGTAVGAYPQMRYAENKYNSILDTIEAIQGYCVDHLSTYLDYNGQTFKVKASNFFI